ncbi:MAG: ATP-dependent helicase [Candidatus Limnocylindrales bacterium]
MHPSVEQRLARLSPDQLAAATAPPGPVLCVAPAGSGKTTTLVARVAWRIATGTAPERICALTFNRRAADELGQRLGEALEPLSLQPGAVRVRTFHALGREILIDAGSSVDLIDRAELLAELAGRRLHATELRRLDDAFSRLKLDAGVDAATVVARIASERAAGREPSPALGAFVVYEEALASRRAIDFDDLVGHALGRLESEATLLARWRERCSAVMVDESQDLDRAQLRLALLLARPANDVFLVGDDDQTIYAWRLADVRRILDLAARLPGLRRVDLVTNRRCPAVVVERATRLVEHNRERFAKRIVARPDAPGTVILAADPADDVTRARRLLAAWAPALRGPDPRSHAVLARTNAELAPFAAAALEAGLHYRAEIDGLDTIDDPMIDRLLGSPALAGGDSPPGATLGRLLAVASHEDRAGLVTIAAWAAGLPSLDAVRSRLAEARAARQRLRVGDAALTLATMHGTKGLEFDVVACVGLDDGRFPSARTLAEADDPIRALEEERRLAYVAWTRARRSLLLVFDPGGPSCFMTEAFDPAELVAAAVSGEATVSATGPRAATATARSRTRR